MQTLTKINTNRERFDQVMVAISDRFAEESRKLANRPSDDDKLLVLR